MKKGVVSQERIRIYDPENNRALYVRVDDDGDYWIEDQDQDVTIWIPRHIGRAMITALERIIQ